MAVRYEIAESALMELLFEEPGVGRCLVAPDGSVLRANAEWLRSTGFTLDDVVGADIIELFPGTRDMALAMHARARAGHRVEVARHAQRVQGRETWWQGQIAPVPMEGGTGLLIMTRELRGESRDVTARRRSEEALSRSEARFRTLADAMPQLVWTADPDGAVDYYNCRHLELAGIERLQDGSWRWAPVLHPDDVGRTEEAWRSAVERGERYEIEHRVRRPDGAFRWHLSRGVPARDEDGRIVKWYGTATDIHDQKEAQRALEEADRRKDAFLAVLSHELRNPLAPIRNSLHLLERAPPGSDPARRALEIVRRQADHLARLVDDLLDITRIRHGKIELQVVRLDAREVVRRAWEDARALFEGRGIELLLAEAGEPLWVDADAARLHQLVGNLLNNALKFTPPRGRVRVRVDRRGGGCEVSVSDTGVGIEPADLERIFEPFAQSERTRPGHGGMGIGLALVRDLASRMGGTVWAESAGPGRGAELLVRLPLAAPPSRLEARSRGEEAGIGLSVVIVEDNEDAAATLAELLALRGHAVRVAGTGDGGVKAVAERGPDVLICDVGLPDMSGHDVIRAVRSAGGGRPVFAIALTGYAQPQDRQAALAAGFDAHLSKPPALEELDGLLRTAAQPRR